GDRHVVHYRDAQQCLDVDVVRLRLQRIPEKDDDVDPSLDDGRTDLLIAAERSAEKSGDVETELLTEDRAGRSGRVQLMLQQGPAVEARPRQQLHLAVVVSDQ